MCSLARFSLLWALLPIAARALRHSGAPGEDLPTSAAGAFAPAGTRQSNKLGQLYETCQAHEELERLFPAKDFGRHAVRVATEGALIVVRDVEVLGLDLSAAMTVRTELWHHVMNVATTEAQNCSLKHPEKAPKNAACMIVRLRGVDIRLSSRFMQQRHYEDIDLSVAFAVEVGASLEQVAKSQLVALAVKSVLKVKTLEIYAEEFSMNGGLGITDRTVQFLINSAILKDTILFLLGRTFESAYQIPELAYALLEKNVLGSAFGSLHVTDRDCNAEMSSERGEFSAGGLCLGFDVALSGDIRSGSLDTATVTELATSLNLTEGLVKFLPVLLPAFIEGCKGLTAGVGVAINDESALQATTDLGMRLLVPDLLAIFGLLEPDMYQSGNVFLKEHAGQKGWLSFGFPTGQHMQVFMAALWQPLVNVDAGLTVKFVMLDGGIPAWHIELHSLNDTSAPLSVSLQAGQMDCSYHDALLWDICDIFGHSVDARVELSGSFLISEVSELIVCTAEPCKYDLSPIQTDLKYESPNVPELRVSSDFSVSAAVKVGPAVEPLGQTLKQFLLREALVGKHREVEVDDAVKAAMADAGSSNADCGIGATFSRLIHTDVPELPWTPGEEKRNADAKRMVELSQLKQVQGRTTLYFRFEPTGAIELLSWSRVGISTDLSLRAWRPDWSSDADSQWLSGVGFEQGQVAWVVEFGGPEVGSNADIEVLVQDFYLSEWKLQTALGQLANCQHGKCSTGVKLSTRLRFLLLSDGSIQGCLGKCCAKSVLIETVRIMDFNSLRLKFLQSLVSSAQSALGSVATHILGHLLPELLTLPLRKVLSEIEKRHGQSKGAGPGDFVSFRLQLSHDFSEDLLKASITPDAHLKLSNDLPGLGWLGDLWEDKEGLYHVKAPGAVSTVLASVVQPGLEHCLVVQAHRPCQPLRVALPVDVTMDTGTQEMSLKLTGVEVHGGIASLNLLLSQALAQPTGVDLRKDYCLADLDLAEDLALRRQAEQVPPLSREPEFEAPLDDLLEHVQLQSQFSMALELVNKTTPVKGQRPMPTEHRLHFRGKGQLLLREHNGFFRPWSNDAGVADFGFIHFSGHGFVREWEDSGLWSSSAQLKEISIQCGSLLWEGETKVDLTDPAVSASMADGPDEEGLTCLHISRPSTMWEYIKWNHVGKTKTYKLCSPNAGDAERFLSALMAELGRQAEFRRRMGSGEYTCDLPVASGTVHALPAKWDAFNWEPMGNSKPPPQRCLDLCRSLRTCAAVAEVSKDKCRYFGHTEVDQPASWMFNLGIMRKRWITA